jgi:hypothetical protein
MSILALLAWLWRQNANYVFFGLLSCFGVILSFKLLDITFNSLLLFFLILTANIIKKTNKS